MPDAGGDGAAAPGLRAQLLGLTDTWRAMTEARLGIFVIEARRAAAALAQTFVCAVLAACVLAATWLLALVGAMWWAVDRGATPALAIGCALIVNLVLIAAAALGARAAMRRVDFIHTRRALRAPEPRR
ncbi:MAG TPA: hypothetical protein PJ986_11250 [Gammaproteobacteria bacterium]|nr:hypothetical protein [Gammaproteobacteria bacterium]